MTSRGESSALKVRGLTKSFFGVRANDQVHFDLLEGEVHGLLGENGAGKSTLCSVLAGLYRPDEGDITIDGERVQFRSPSDASLNGIGMVHQHFRLVPSFTVAENILLGLPDQPLRLSVRSVKARLAELAEEYGFDVPPDAYIWQLSVGEQQAVEILRQLYRGARFLILDEPTAVLAPQQAENLFEAVGEMAQRGHAIILVSHKMEEILGHTDRVTVLRHGRNAGTVVTAETNAVDLAKMIVGAGHMPPPSAVAEGRPRVGPSEDSPTLRVRDLVVIGDRGRPAVNGVSVSVDAGQIVGVAGVSGNGQRELHEAIAGLRPAAEGAVHVGDRDVTSLGPRARSKAGLAYVPEDRLGTGLASGMTLDENLIIKSYAGPPHSRHGALLVRAIAATTKTLTENFDIKGARAGMPVSLMSGGNLQKAIVARELTLSHTVLLAASPTRGLDLAATAAVRKHIVNEAEQGVAVLLFSEDLGEIIELSDRVVVMSGGRIVGSCTRDSLDVQELGLLMTGTTAKNP